VVASGDRRKAEIEGWNWQRSALEQSHQMTIVTYIIFPSFENPLTVMKEANFVTVVRARF
jgi:hypothetical protein